MGSVASGAPPGVEVPNLPPSSDLEDRARTHFAKGYEFGQRGDYEAAVHEFREAFRLSPNPSVLLNLGHAYAGSGQPVEAYDAFQEYLRIAHGQLDAKRERAVKQFLNVAGNRIGELRLEVNPTGASIEIDGRPIGTAPLASTVRLRTGTHALVVRAAGYETYASSVDVLPRGEQRVLVHLAIPQSPAEPGHISIYCPVPDFEVVIDSKLRAKTPVSTPISVAPGSHELSFRRQGYLSDTLVLDVRSGAAQMVPCNPRVDPKLSERISGKLSILTGPAHSSRPHVQLDGKPLLERAIVLPAGRHDIEVAAPGHHVWSTQVSLTPGKTLRLAPALVPTSEYSRLQAAKEEKLFWSKVMLGSGIGITAIAATFGAISLMRHADWKDKRGALNVASLNDPNVSAQLHTHQHEALEIQRAHYISLSGLVLGGALSGLGAFLWISSASFEHGETQLSDSARYNGLHCRGNF